MTEALEILGVLNLWNSAQFINDIAKRNMTEALEILGVLNLWNEHNRRLINSLWACGICSTFKKLKIDYIHDTWADNCPMKPEKSSCKVAGP
jgi:hypothetical protein